MAEPIIKTERLILRNLTEQDAQEIYDYRNDERCFRYQRWDDTSRQAIKKLVTEYKQSDFLSKENEQHYAITLKNDEIIGDLTCFYSDRDCCVTLGYTISYKHHRQGYAFEMLSAVIEKIRQHSPELEIVGLVEKENIPSINLLKKLGFCEECYEDTMQSYIYVIPAGQKPKGAQE